MVKLPAPFSTKDTMASMRALLVGHSGVGKSTNLANMEKAYGKGLILSGEKGLSSIADVDIDAYEFTAYETETYDVVDDEGNKSRRRHIRFRDLMNYCTSADFKSKYKWVGIDSMTALSSLIMEECKAQFTGWDVFSQYQSRLHNYEDWIRSLEVPSLTICLAAEETNDNGSTEYWPMLDQKKVQKNFGANFDFVFCLVRKTSEQDNKMVVSRYLITDNVKGWHGKVRDPKRVLRSVENESDVTILMKRVADMKGQMNNE